MNVFFIKTTPFIFLYTQLVRAARQQKLKAAQSGLKVTTYTRQIPQEAQSRTEHHHFGDTQSGVSWVEAS